MVLLTALNLPSLTPLVLAFLAGEQIVTVEDFLVHDLQQLAAVAEPSFLSTEIKQAVTDVLLYLESLQEWSSGYDIVNHTSQFLPISCESVDSLLHGGLREGTVTELVGTSSTGKTQICMQAAASVAYKLRSAVVYVDTCNAFSAQRVAHMLGSLLGSKSQIKSQWDDLALAMKGIQRIRLFDVFSMLSFLHILHGSLQSNSGTRSEFSKLGILIIDSTSSVIAPLLGGNHAQGHAVMVNLGQSLKKLAIENRIAVLITNHTVTGDEGQLRPALGESWISVPHVRLLCSRDTNSGICTMSLIKHTSLTCNKQATFRIGRAGLQSVRDRKNVGLA